MNKEFNTIRLIRINAFSKYHLPSESLIDFALGHTGEWNEDIIQVFKREEEDEARKALKEKGVPQVGNIGNEYDIYVYALEYCKCDDDGEFIIGSDYDTIEVNELQDLAVKLSVDDSWNYKLYERFCKLAGLEIDFDMEVEEYEEIIEDKAAEIIEKLN